MYTKQDLIQCLKDMGLKSTDAIMVHSSMKAIGEVEGGADTVVDAFIGSSSIKTSKPAKNELLI